MKYLLKRFLILLIIFCLLKMTFHVFDKGHNESYYIGNYKVEETLNVSDNNNYYFVLTDGKFKINFQIYHDFNKNSNVIKEIYHGKEDGYQCVLPIFKDKKILTDVLCLKDNQLYEYHTLDKDLSFISKFKGYSKEKYKDQSTEKKLNNTVAFYEKNLINNHYIAMENYRGLTLFNSVINNIKLFDSDVYTKDISFFFDKYYITADYNSQYTFKKFYLVNLINGNQKEIRSYNDISFDSYIQGYYKGKIYLFDRENKCQYIIDIKNERIDQNNKIEYYDGKMHEINVSEALENKLFRNYAVKSNYDLADKYKDYYYFYKKQNDKYLVYRADKNNKKLLTYIFTTTDVNSVSYFDNYVYFVNGNSYYYYGPNGTRKLIENNEKEFNKNIKFGTYVK